MVNTQRLRNFDSDRTAKRIKPKREHKAVAPVPPFLASASPQPVRAASSPVPDDEGCLPSDVAFVVSWYLQHPDLIQRAVNEALPPAKPSLDFMIAAWVRYLLAAPATRILSEDKTHWHKMKLLEAQWHAQRGQMPPEIPKGESKPAKPRKRHAAPITMAVAA